MRDIDGTARSAMGALQRDMKMLGDITICTGLKRYIACIEGSNLAITKAFWGRISDKVCPSDDGDPVTDCDGSEDTLPLVKGYCEGKRECKLEARHTLLQKNGTHHCPGVNKYLVVNYTCIPESKSVALCDSAETTLTCEAGWVIDIADIFWGRRSHAKYCGAEEGMECDSSDSAAKYIRSNCDGHRRCVVRADPALLDNAHSPCTTILKYLMINYVCKPPEKDPVETEMMGLLENHVSSAAPKMSTASVQESRSSQPYQPSLQTSPASSPSYSTRKSKNKYFTQQEESSDELSKALLGGVGLPVDLSSEHYAKKQDVVKMLKAPDVPVVGTKRDNTAGPEGGAKKDKGTVSGTKRDKGLKEGMKKFKEQLMDDGYYDDEFAKITQASSKTSKEHDKKTTQAGSVRSLLARAKEVLQTLGSDNTKFEAVVDKRGHIPVQNTTVAMQPETPAADVAMDTTKADLNLLTQSDLAHDLSSDHEATPVINDIITQTAAAFASKSPKETLVKKTILPIPQNNNQFGNTP